MPGYSIRCVTPTGQIEEKFGMVAADLTEAVAYAREIAASVAAMHASDADARFVDVVDPSGRMLASIPVSLFA
jgi:hypothetical protein